MYNCPHVVFSHSTLWGEDKDWQPGGAVNDHKSEASPDHSLLTRWRPFAVATTCSTNVTIVTLTNYQLILFLFQNFNSFLTFFLSLSIILKHCCFFSTVCLQKKESLESIILFLKQRYK